MHFSNHMCQLNIQTTEGSRDKRVLSAEVFIVVHS